jgi:hypothetical protein
MQWISNFLKHLTHNSACKNYVYLYQKLSFAFNLTVTAFILIKNFNFSFQNGIFFILSNKSFKISQKVIKGYINDNIYCGLEARYLTVVEIL